MRWCGVLGGVECVVGFLYCFGLVFECFVLVIGYVGVGRWDVE